MIEEQPKKSDWKSLRSVYNSAFFCSLGVFFVSFLLPIIAYDSMGASGLQVALVFSMLTLGTALFSPLAGKFAKRGRRRPSIFFGASLRAVAYVGMAISIYLNSVYYLIANSLLWGLGVAFYRVGSDAEISERVLHENRAEAFGHRSAANARGTLIGAVLGFILFFIFDIYIVFYFYALMNIYGGLVVIRERPPLEQREVRPLSKVSNAIGKGIIALVFAAAIDALVMSFLSPFVELYLIHSFENLPIEWLAVTYIPSGVISAVFAGRIGRYADKANKVLIVSGAAVTVSAATIAIAYLPVFMAGVAFGFLWLGVLFAITGVAGTAAYTVMTSVLGTAYEGRASEGFGWFEAAMGLARVSGPAIGGLLWDFVNPMAPFIFVGFAELLLIPAYYVGMKRYEGMLEERSDAVSEAT